MPVSTESLKFSVGSNREDLGTGEIIRCHSWCHCAELCAPAGVCWARGMPGMDLAPSMPVFVSVTLGESSGHL